MASRTLGSGPMPSSGGGTALDNGQKPAVGGADDQAPPGRHGPIRIAEEGGHPGRDRQQHKPQPPRNDKAEQIGHGRQSDEPPAFAMNGEGQGGDPLGERGLAAP